MDDIRDLRDEAAHIPPHQVWAKGGPVYSRLSTETVHGLEGRAIASFGDAASLGLWAFATGIWITGLFQTGILSMRETSLLFPTLLIYAGIVLFIAGLFLYRRNDNFLGSMFCSFAAINMSRAVLLILVHSGILPGGGTATVVEGALMESWAYIALSLFAASSRMNRALMLVLICTLIGYALGGLPFITNDLTQGGWLEAGRIGGYFMFAAGFFAYYSGTAVVVNTAFRRLVLPLGGPT
ncbi:MAG TPA: GPR1/FUN34/YaaH family transporter [Stellaceae bacterium]|nr:GPR1/FUN34/YaaH family transporter [Stellaceae bacterium]